MRKIVFLILIIISYPNFSAISQEIPQHIKDKFIKAIDLRKNGQYEKSIPLINEIIDYTELSNNSDLTKLMKQQKMYCYFGIAEEKATHDIKYGLKEACTKGLRLCNDIGEAYSLSSMMFSIWIAGYYYMNDEYRQSSYAIEYSKRMVKECRNRKITDNEVFIELETMIASMEREINKQINPPPTYSLSLGSLYDAFTSNSSESTYIPSNDKKTNVIIEDDENITQVKITEDGEYKYGTYRSPKYKIVCPNGYINHIYYNVQKRCWMKTSSAFCDYSSTKGDGGLKGSAKILCGNN